jgi:hypothetical protein
MPALSRAIPLKPKTPAIIAKTKNASVQSNNIVSPLFVIKNKIHNEGTRNGHAFVNNYEDKSIPIDSRVDF